MDGGWGHNAEQEVLFLLCDVVDHPAWLEGGDLYE